MNAVIKSNCEAFDSLSNCPSYSFPVYQPCRQSGPFLFCPSSLSRIPYSPRSAFLFTVFARHCSQAYKSFIIFQLHFPALQLFPRQHRSIFYFPQPGIDAIGFTAATSITPSSIPFTMTLQGNIVPILSSTCKALCA